MVNKTIPHEQDSRIAAIIIFKSNKTPHKNSLSTLFVGVKIFNLTFTVTWVLLISGAKTFWFSQNSLFQFQKNIWLSFLWMADCCWNCWFSVTFYNTATQLGCWTLLVWFKSTAWSVQITLPQIEIHSGQPFSSFHSILESNDPSRISIRNKNCAFPIDSMFFDAALNQVYFWIGHECNWMWKY